MTIMASRPVLERIILNNFNSFKVDDVPFHKGFTVITGPNGAGKSTIFQGVKFALGSNEKDGRAKVWSDFIRIGQKGGYSEIHLRDKKKLIKIRRTILKGQAPFYQLQNGTDSKLKKCSVNTVQTLLLGFGINPDNVFAFVSQGNITSIKNMEKKEICDYLERGLGLYPLRGEILSNKSTINKLESQISSLDLMDKAAKYELSILAPQIIRLNEKHELEKERNRLEKERTWLNRAKIQQEILQIQTEISTLNENTKNLKKDEEKVTITIEQLESTIKENNEKITSLTQHLLDEKVKEKNLDLEIDKYQTNKDNLADKILRTKSKIKLLKAEKKRFAEDLKICTSELEKYQFELSILHDQRKSLLEEFESHQKTKKRYQNEMEKYRQLKDTKNNVDLQLKDNSLQIEAIDRDIKSAMNEIRYLRQELEKDKWFLKDPQKNSKDSLHKKKQKINHALEKLSRNTSLLEKENRGLEKQIEELKSSGLMKEMPKTQNIINLEKEINTRNLNVIGRIIDYIDFNPDIAPAVDSILSKYVLNSFIASNKQEFLLVQELIKRTGARCNVYQPLEKEIKSYRKITKEEGVFGYLADFIQPVSHHDSVKKVIVSICRNTVLVKDRSIGYDFINQNNHRGRVVSLDGTVIRSYDYALESRASESRKTYSSPVEQRREMKRLQNELMEKRRKIDEYYEQNNKLERALAKLDERLQKISTITFNYKKMTITINKKDSLLVSKGKLTDERNSIQIELNSIQNEINQVQKKFPENLEEIDEFINEFQDKFTEIDKRMEQMNNKLTSKAKEENLITLKIDKYATDFEDSTRKLKKHEDELKKGSSRILEAINEIEKLRDSIESINKKQLALSENNVNIQEVIQTEQNGLNSIIQAIERIQIKIEYTNAQIYEKKKKVENISIEISELGDNYQERSIEEVENDLRVIYEKLREYYDVTDQILERKLELEEEITRTTQKKTELETEVQEAQTSVNSLQEEYFTLFGGHLETIQQNINTRFDKIGIRRKGLMKLSGEFEQLGVDIFVQYDDTSRRLSSLSGGEQTLFAISLMLTLQNLHPSPLCVFDEAQMFLDKSNTESVSKLIKDVTSDGVQFIMITPNASNSLMNLADSVLGIAKNGSEEVSTVIQL